MTRLETKRLALQLSRGELVAFPTETVYGLGASATDDLAVAKIFTTKGRPADHPLIVHVKDMHAISHFAHEVPSFAQRLLRRFSPGPLTVILSRRAGVATASAGRQDSIGIRIPSHPLAQDLLQAAWDVGVLGVSAPSANKFGRVSPTTAQHVQDEFAAEIAHSQITVLDGGACTVGIESTIVDCTRGAPVLLRPGVISTSELEAAMGLGLTQEGSLKTATPKASGTLESHYAPRAKVMLLQALPDKVPQGVALYALPTDPAQAAHELFAKLRELDASGVHEIWIHTPSMDASWDGVRDRLCRAAA